MGFRKAYRLRLERQRLRFRAWRKRRELQPVVDRTATIRPGAIVLFCVLRNERPRLAYFLDYYRRLGIGHFVFVDNGSEDGSDTMLAAEPDVSLWRTAASYRRARFGVDWLNHLARRHAHGHWALTVDVDEFLVYPFCDTRPLGALTDWLDAGQRRSLAAMQLDLYPKGPVDAAVCAEGADPVEVAPWFDAANYTIRRNDWFGNLWIQGGPRARAFFAAAPDHAPALNKIPLVKWHRSYAYVMSTHMALPRGLNATYDEWGGEMTSGCLLHAKFLSSLTVKTREEMTRGEHYGGGREYRAYGEGGALDLWREGSERYAGWRQLETLGLMSSGNWA